MIRGDIYFVDGALLHFRELIDLESSPSRLMYSYHYQRADTSLVFRYDDTPYHPNYRLFPITNMIRPNRKFSPPNRLRWRTCWMKSGGCVLAKNRTTDGDHLPSHIRCFDVYQRVLPVNLTQSISHTHHVCRSRTMSPYCRP